MKATPIHNKTNDWRLPALIALVVFLCFMPTLNCGFVNWDDNVNYTENPNYRGLSLRHLLWMFTDSFDSGLYMPLTWLTLGIDYVLWEMNPAGYHLTNLLLHAANSLVLYWLMLIFLKRFSTPFMPSDTIGMQICAAVGVLFFAIHPLRVESVAWLTERRDVLSGFFYLLTIVAYLNMKDRAFKNSKRRRWFISSLFFFTCSLLSKPWGITLPVVFLILDIYPLDLLRDTESRLHKLKKLFIEKIPYGLLTLLSLGLTAVAQGQTRGVQTLNLQEIVSRSVQAAYALCFYLWKTIIPIHLSPIYPIQNPFNPFEWQYVFCLFVVLLTTSLLILLRRRCPWALAAWVCYVVIVSPFLGFFYRGYHIAADRYTYISCLPIAVLIGTGMAKLFKKRQNRMTLSCSGISVLGGVMLCFILYSVLTINQIGIWRDGISLWKHALRLTSTDHIVHTNLGSALAYQGKSDDALKHFYEALRIQPDSIMVRYNAANILKKQGRRTEAIEHYRKVLGANPDHAPAHNNLATTLIRVEAIEKAIADQSKLVERPVDSSAIRNQLLEAHRLRDVLDKAIFHFKESLRIAPDSDITPKNVEQALMFRRKIDEVVSKFQNTLQLSQKTEP